MGQHNSLAIRSTLDETLASTELTCYNFVRTNAMIPSPPAAKWLAQTPAEREQERFAGFRSLVQRYGPGIFVDPGVAPNREADPDKPTLLDPYGLKEWIKLYCGIEEGEHVDRVDRLYVEWEKIWAKRLVRE